MVAPKFEFYQASNSEVLKLKEKYKDKKIIGEVVGILKDEYNNKPIIGIIDIAPRDEFRKR